MGTYTTNYNLFMPTVGETGWGELVNGNFTTIDTTMKELDTRVGTLEPLSVIQVDENQNVTFPAKVTALGGVDGATSLNTVVTVSASSVVIDYCRHAVINILPYIPGVLYTGVVACCTANSRSGARLYTLSSSDTWSAHGVALGNPSAITISNVKCAIGYSGTDEYAFGFKLPIFT